MKNWILNLLICSSLGSLAQAVELKVGDAAPDFKIQTQAGKSFELSSRKGTWTILYFYPKAETPGCTKQACSFRDDIEKIRKLGADVYGISTDTVEAQAQFHAHHKLNFELLADSDGKVTELFGAKMPMLNMSKRWTFIIDPELKIQAIDRDVDPTLDPKKTATTISNLQEKSKKTTGEKK